MSYVVHGDPYSDPPRAKVCTECGLLVGDEERHTQWHTELDRHEHMTLGVIG